MKSSGRVGHSTPRAVPTHERGGRAAVDPAPRVEVLTWLVQVTPMTRCQEKGPKEVAVVGWFRAFAVRRRYSSGTVLPWTTMRWKFGTSYDGWLFQAS